MGSLARLVAELRSFDDRGEVVKQLRREIREPIPAVRAAIKARALRTLPRRGGLNRWAASTRITARVQLSGRRASVTLVGARRSVRGESDVRALDRGRVRHPSWGRRTRGQWHTQLVPPAFFSGPAAEVDRWRDAAVRAVDRALATIGG